MTARFDDRCGLPAGERSADRYGSAVRDTSGSGVGGRSGRWLGLILLFGLAGAGAGWGQENPLGQVQTPAPKPAEKPAEAPGATVGAPRGGARIHVDVNLVLVPFTVTTEQTNRLVTGLEANNFEVYDNNIGQVIKTFSTEDAPVTVGIVFDLSGSMQSKFFRARKALSEFLRTSNPADEFFVVGFNDRPAVIVDYTSDVEDVEARMVMLRPENRTALIDAVYLGVNKLKEAKYDRRALLIVSDGGDNRSRYTEGELRRVVRESNVQIYSIGIYDTYAPTAEEELGPVLLKDISETTGGRMFPVSDAADMADIATRISAELRNEYVIGYRPSEVKKDGNWRKLKVRLVPPPGLPAMAVHHRQGYYAPSQ